MKKIAVPFFCAALIFLFTNTLHAQILKFGVMGGLTNISAPTTYTNSISNSGEGFGANFNFGAQLRMNIPLLPLTPIVFVDYHMLRGSGNAGNLSVNTSQNILSAGIEAEYNILPIPLVSPYISVEAALNNFGELSNGITSQGSMTRYGGAIGVGAMLTVLPIVDLDVSLKYNFFNLIGKSSGEESINALTLNIALIF